MFTRRRALGALTLLVCLGAVGAAGDGCQSSAYFGLTPVAGDDHHHAGSLISHFVAYEKQAGLDTVCPHEFGKPEYVYERNRAAGYDWLVIAHHDRATHGGMTGDPNGTSMFRTHRGAYQWWTGAGSRPLRLPNGTAYVSPNPLGLPNYRSGGTVVPGYNEALSFSTAAAKENAAAGSFVAFAGREFTTLEGTAQSAAKGQGGHKIVVLPASSDRICGYLGTAQGRTNDCDETQLYDWVYDQGGVIIQAHPGTWAAGMTPWHPDTAPAGITELFVHGVEVGSAGGLRWEDGFQTALGSGVRVFPSFGSDRHSLQLAELGIGCSNGSAPSLAYGAVICWASDGGASPDSVVEAMRERRCYYTRSHQPRLEYELRDELTSAPVLMGGMARVPDHVAQVRVAATNAIQNQTASVDRRFGRLELVHVRAPMQETVLHACTACCVRDAQNGDRCVLEKSLSVPDGALYPRVCEGTAPCGRNGANTQLIGAPIFVNWPAFKASRGRARDLVFDFDRDGVPAVWDNCWTDPNADQRDSDRDGAGDACDVCPSVSDPLQIDANSDGVGDACD